ncbi:AMP-binding protein [Chelativorans sp. ZYF759]|uniref:class I adenylate-forming enzyme family protein n=1 Tax=Chelativorans sp. ZYF759 TaxID=2692213 RepID=UPI00145C6CC3|nr:class I adenylate-forming enzyme family protein [Chelativorans sp. ZYF759]NMG41686.1 AMP-binding protein [Chelativorans sp. ZYF759]
MHALPAVETGAISYAAMLRETAQRHPDGIAIVIDENAISYRELLNRAVWRARELKALGLERGDAVGLLMPNSVDFIELFLGAALIGVAVVPMNTRFKAFETAHILTDSGVKAVFTTGAIDAHTNFKDLLFSALPGLKDAGDPWNLQLGGFPRLSAVVHLGDGAPASMINAVTLREAASRFAAPGPQDEPGSEDTQLIMYTSGTTARPKGCIMPNRCLVVTARLVADLFPIGEEDGWWCPLPMFHIGGLLFMSVCLAVGGKFVGMTWFDVEKAFDQFEREKPTVLYPLFPTIALPIIGHARFPKTSFDAVRYVFDVGPAEIQLRLQAAFPKALLLSAFGMTETTGIVTYNWPTDTLEERTTTVGHFLPGWSAIIVDPETREEVTPGEPGEIAVRGPGLFGGYLNNSELTRQAFNAQGYFHTGDYGAVNAQGLLKYLGRLKDQMKVGGENVSALEVESFLATHPAIKLAQVVGIPDERYGEVAGAFVELVEGAELGEQGVLSHCDGQIARFKIPRHVRFVTDWPMSATKIEKYKLRQSLIDELGLG